MSEFLSVVTTTGSAVSSAALARSAVGARLAACAQVDGPVVSTYWWGGGLETAEEWRITFKTTAGRFPELEAHLKAGHPYDTPEVIATPVVAGSAEYLAWVAAETEPR